MDAEYLKLSFHNMILSSGTCSSTCMLRKCLVVSLSEWLLMLQKDDRSHLTVHSLLDSTTRNVAAI